MIRKFLPFLLTVCLICTFTGCGRRTDDTSSTVSGASSEAVRGTPEPEVSALPDASEGSGSASSSDSSGSSSSPDATVTPQQELGSFGPFREALQGVYGDKYYPDTRLTDEQIRTELGLDESLYEEVYAENVAEKAHPDTFIAVKVKEGKTEAVKEKLMAYKQRLAQDADFADYADKIDAAQVYAEGDYVFFLLVGDAESTGSGENSEGMAETLGKEVQRGIDAIKEALGMM